MPSNYTKKKPKLKTDPQAYQPYVASEQVMCSNCGRYSTVLMTKRYSKCCCGGTYQKFGVKPWPGKSEMF
jgi:hypothetical protein